MPLFAESLSLFVESLQHEEGGGRPAHVDVDLPARAAGGWARAVWGNRLGLHGRNLAGNSQLGLAKRLAIIILKNTLSLITVRFPCYYVI